MNHHQAVGRVPALFVYGFCAMALAWLLPNHYPPWWSFYSEATMAVALSLIVVGWAMDRKASELAVPTSAIVLAAMALLPWLQFAGGQLAFRSDAAVTSLYLCAWSVAVSVGRSAANRFKESFAEKLAVAILAPSVVSAFLALMQGLQVSGLNIWSLDIYPGERAGANLGQANNLATLLTWGLLSLWHLFENRRLTRPTAALLCAVLLLGLATTQSRTALMYGPVVILGHMLGARRGLHFRLHLRSVCAIAFLSWVAIAIWPNVLEAALVSGELPSVKARGLSSPRWHMWHLLLDAARQNPWTGYGWLQVGAAQLAIADVHPPVGEMWLHGHNLFVELVVWCGFPLGGLIGGALVWWWVRRALSVSTMMAVMAFLAITCFGLHAMLELPYHYLYFLVPVGLFMGQVEAEAPDQRWGAPSRWLAIPIAAAALVLAVVIAKDYLKVEEDFRLMRFELMGVKTIPTEQLAPDAPYLDGITAYLTFIRQQEHIGMSDAKLRDWTDLVARYPQPSAISKLARAMALNGRVNEAGVLMIKLRHMHGEREFNRHLADLDSQMSAGHTELRPLLLELQRPASAAPAP